MLVRLLSLRVLLASGAMHVGLAAGIASGGPAHATSGMAAEALEIDVVTESVEPSSSMPEPPDEDRTARVAAPPRRAVPHEHPFVVPGHNARAHDPSSPHATPETGAAAQVAELTAMPSFTLPGTGSMTAGSTRVVPAAASDGAASDGRASDGLHGGGDVDVDVDVPAKVIATVAAAYPNHARDAGIEVDVVLDIIVDVRGRVAEARVRRSGAREFDDAALAAVRQYRFSPAERAGRTVRVRMAWTVQFRLQ